jgi:amidase
MLRSAIVVLALSVLTFPLAAQKPADGPRSQLQLVEATIYELQHALRTGLVTSEQLVEMYLARIAAYDDAGPGVNASIHINETALDEARDRDAERRRGHKTHPLFGIPVLLKDNIDTADMPTTAGSVALEGSIPPDDAFITQKLRDAGAIILGKATLTEFANFIAIGMPPATARLAATGSTRTIRARFR